MTSGTFQLFAVQTVQGAGTNDLAFLLRDHRADESQDGGFGGPAGGKAMICV